MKINRTSAVRALAVISVAFAAGHVVQNLSDAPRPARAAEVTAQTPRDIQLLAAEVEDSVFAPPLQVAAVASAQPAPPAATGSAPPIHLAALSAPDLALPTAPLAAAPAAIECSLSLDLRAEPGAMASATLLAPCHPGERIMIHHAGLAITGQTTASGSLDFDLTALEQTAKVVIVFGNGEVASGAVDLPDFAGVRRFGVQWQADRDAFQLQAFEDGASYGDPGHLSAGDPTTGPDGVDAQGSGFLTLLGDPTTPLPMLAEIYTFPRKPALGAEVVIEAAVTAATCGHEMIGETLSSNAGIVTVTELTLAMPDCDAIGDFLVLKNLAPDMTLAAAD